MQKPNSSCAAGLKGKVEAAANAKLLMRLRMHRIPAEHEAADDALRYFEANVQNGTFAFTHIAPGRYLLLARVSNGGADEAGITGPRPAAWDAASRDELRREAEAANVFVELAPCQRLSDVVLRYELDK